MRAAGLTPRRVLLLIVVSLAAAVSAEIPEARKASGVTSAQPNILVIVTDDQRYKAGYDFMPTVMQRFRSEGTEFSQAVATTPLCCPSRASIFTGQYTHNHGVWGNDPGTVPGLVLPDVTDIKQETTMQYYLQNAGYRTAIFGKYLNKWPLDDIPPYFDEWAIFANSKVAYNGGTWQVDDGGKKKVPGYYSLYLGDRAVSFIHDSADQPWFLEVATAAPHEPYVPEDQYKTTDVGVFDGNDAVREKNKTDKPKYIQDSHSTLGDAQPTRDKQIRTLISVDDMVERIFAELEASGQLDNTIAFFFSDNGFMWAEHGRIGKRPPYKQSIRVPFFARWPGHIDAGAVDDRMVGPLDIAPTVFDAAGIVPTHVVDGHSLLSSYKRSSVLIEFGKDVEAPDVPTWAGTYVEGDYVFTQNYKDDGSISFKEYYDLKADPWQLTNILHDGDPGNNPDLGPLQDALDAQRACAGASCP
jgi:arylsulfatase A-like enzyme